MNVRGVEFIQFGIFSATEIRKMAVCEVNNKNLSGVGSVYDKSMGTVGDNNEPCITCGLKKECQGHFGYINLAVPILHPLYYSKIASFLRCFCKQCHKLLFMEEQVILYGIDKMSGKKRYQAILDRTEKIDICSHCNYPQPKIVYKQKDNSIFMEHKQKDRTVGIEMSVENISKIFSNISDQDVSLLGFDPDHFHPKNLVMTVLPVMPPCSRPYVVSDGNICDDDLTSVLLDIIKINLQLSENEVKNRQKLTNQLVFKISTMYDNSKGKATHPTNKRPIKSIKCRLVGKDGRFRLNMMGKRVDYSARTVIGAEPTLEIGQVGIPLEVARIHTKPETVTKFNIEWLQNIVNNGEANFIKRKRSDGTTMRINLNYAMHRKGTELLFDDIVVRGDIKIEEDSDGNAIIPEPRKELKVTHINTTKTVRLQKGDKIIRKKKAMILPSVKKVTLKNGDVLIQGDIKLKKKDGEYIVPKSHGAVEVIQVVSGNIELKEGDQLIRDNRLVEVEYPSKKHIALRYGDIVQRHLRGPEIRNGEKVKGDIVLFNRQPTLHKGSMMAMEVVPGDVPGIPGMPYKTFRFNLAATKSFNADFDGDEMNIHAPQSYRAEVELRNLSAVQKNMISPQNSCPIIVPVQDTLLAVYLMTIKNMKLSKIQFTEISQKGKNVDGSPLFNQKKIGTISRILKKYNKPSSPYTSNGLISLLFPHDFHYKVENNTKPDDPVLEISYGVLVSGAFDKKCLSSSFNCILLLLHKEYGAERAANFLDNLHFITNAWLMVHGFSVGLEDCMITSDESAMAIKNTLMQCYAQAQAIEENTQNPGIREVRVTAALNQAKDVGMRIAKNAMKSDNNFLFTVNSGAKGDFFNIAQLTGVLGQQNIEGQRVKPVLNHGKRTLPHYPFEGLTKEREYESRGFVRNSFIRGLSPEETFFHSKSGREGICDTATGTAKTGYIQRKIIKVCEDIHAEYDGTVRDSTDKIIQFNYGELGLDPAKTVTVGGKTQICDIGRLADRLNLSFEESDSETGSESDSESDSEDEDEEEMEVKENKNTKELRLLIKKEFPTQKISSNCNEETLSKLLKNLRIANADSSDEDS